MIILTVILLLMLMLLGVPLYLVLSGASLIAFNWNEFSNPVIFLDMFRMINVPILIAIPLFTFAGFILSASKAPNRIVNLNNLLLGWLPGGLGIVSIISCAVLTAFTGASGVTIIALGGLLLPSLIKQGYSENFTIGLLTTSGSRGLLFPPSLPLILYAVITKLSIDDLFKACLIPGIMGIAFMIIFCMIKGKKIPVKQKASLKESFNILKNSSAEVPLPFIVLGGIYSGLFTINEAACISVLYVLIVEVFLLKEIHLTKKLPDLIINSMALVGSILLILAAALSFTSYLVDEQIPFIILNWMKQYIHSKYVFLILLNLFLLVVGCMMDIFSAIIIIVPLIHPVAADLGINPFHLGVIFLINLEIGYSTPPVGLNLFIASRSFKQPLIKIYKDTLPFLVILFILLALVTFCPVLSLILL